LSLTPAPPWSPYLTVFLVQQSQNRDIKALEVKQCDLIIAVKGAHNVLANAEELSESELESPEREYRDRAALARRTQE
jgi:low affinity Fe/Cu permease